MIKKLNKYLKIIQRDPFCIKVRLWYYIRDKLKRERD